MTAAPSPGGAGSGVRPAHTSEFSGRTLAHFAVLDLVGSGGFGEVYRARDTRLDRIVAIKVLPEVFAVDVERRERFRREAIAASALNHPNICTVHDVVEADGHHLIVMELVEGQTLHERLKGGPIAVTEALPLAIQIAEALGEAHRAGILHRDIKCRNIALTNRGQVKVLDFGLAKLLDTTAREDEQTLEKLTAQGASPGTPGYMSPEQLLGQSLDARSDLFSFGVVLYRMVTGRLPFEGVSGMALADAILHSEPQDFGEKPIPERLKEIIRKLLRKDREKRYASAEEVHVELKALAEALAPARRAGFSRAPWAALAAVVVLAIAGGGWIWHRWSHERWALGTIPEIERLIDQERFLDAGALLRQAREILPKEPSLESLWTKATGEVSIETTPAGARVSIRPYGSESGPWQVLGQSPIKNVRVPSGLYQWRIVLPGFDPVSFLDHLPAEEEVTLSRNAGTPTEMVHVPGGTVRLGSPLRFASLPATLDDYLIDEHEVTNEEYKRFVDSGAYGKPAFWKQPFIEDGRRVAWENAIARFRDSTGRPGPATWEAGSFLAGQEKHPVSGVSWYEAVAYAEFSGKSLPSAYHWTWAAQIGCASEIVPGSNFRKVGTQPVGRTGTSSGFGTTDMAGNVKEWCWNEGGAGTRLILGGGFADPPYMFPQTDAQSPWRRDPQFGFRCVKLLSPAKPETGAKLERVARDPIRERPVSSAAFSAFKSLYSYDRGELNVKIEETSSSDDWTRQRISFDAAYGGERVTALLFLPKRGSTPFQTVIYFPGAWAYFQPEFDSGMDGLDFLLKSGRAILVPAYKGLYSRRDGLKIGGSETNPPAVWRDHVIAWSRDLGRSIDYLETRSDIDSRRLAYVGLSLGSNAAFVLLAVEDRIRVAALLSGGLYCRAAVAEAEPVNFLSHVRTPVLMLNGRLDDRFPMTWSALPAFQLLGTPAADKRQVYFDCGHGDLPRKDFIRESLAWLDKYLGPVRR